MRTILPDEQSPLPVAATSGIGFLRIASLSMLTWLAGDVRADPVQPFRAQNLNPFVVGAGLPAAASPFLGDRTGKSAYVQLDMVNNSVARSREGESVIVDGETYRALVGFRYALAPRVELSAAIPWLAHSPGFLDNFISNWHEFFGLPNGERDGFAPEQLQYSYAARGRRNAMDQRNRGLGDAQLSAAWQLAETAQKKAAALRATVDLATGRAETLTGSGAREVAIDFTLGHRALFSQSRVSAFASTGILRSGNGAVLANLRRDWVTFGSASIGWEFRPRLAVNAQIDAHTPIFSSELTPLGGAGIQLTVGGQAQFSEYWRLDFAIGENLHTGATPDVVFHFAIVQDAW